MLNMLNILNTLKVSNIIRYIKRWWYKADLEKRLKPIDEEYELFYLRPAIKTLKDYSWFNTLLPKTLKEKHTITIYEQIDKPQEEINREILESTWIPINGNLSQRTNNNAT